MPSLSMSWLTPPIKGESSQEMLRCLGLELYFNDLEEVLRGPPAVNVIKSDNADRGTVRSSLTTLRRRESNTLKGLPTPKGARHREAS